MAVTQTGSTTVQKKEQNQPLGTQYEGLKGIQENTGVNLMKYQHGYQPSERVRDTQYQLEQVQSQKPQGYNSKYGAQLDSIMEQIQNPKDFKFSFNGDALFNSYKDEYTQRGRQASMDAMGQAAALTGGYGNSYAQAAGNQAYQQWLLGLNDKAMDIYDRAYQRYQDEQGALKDRYGMLADAEQRDYDRSNDEYQKWLQEREFAAQQAAAAEEQDYSRFGDERAYWQNLAESENKDYWTETNFNEDVRRNDRDYTEGVRQFDLNFNEGVRQFNETLAEQQREFDADLAERVAQRQEEARQFDASLQWEKMSSDQKYAAGFVETMIENGQIPTIEQLMGVGMSEGDATNWVNQLVAAQQPVATGGGGPSGNNTTKVESPVYVDNSGNYYTLNKNNKTGTIERGSVDSTQVGNNTLVHNIYSEGAERRRSNR